MKSGIRKELFDTSVRPQDDLYTFANGAWLKTHQIPADRSNDGITYELFEAAEKQVREIIEGDNGKIGALYKSFIDVERINRAGIDPIRGAIAKIAAITDAKTLIAAIAELEVDGFGGIFGAFVDTDHTNSSKYILYFMQSGLSLPDEAYYREDDYQPIRVALVDHISKMAQISGLEIDGQSVLDLETKIASYHFDQVKDRDAMLTYNKLTRAEFEELCGTFDLATYISASKVNPKFFESVIVREPQFFEGLGKLFSQFDLAAWKNWTLWHLLSGSAGYLHEELVNQNFAFYGTTLSGTPKIRERWKRAISLVEGSIGEEVGKEYVRRHFPPSSKAQVQHLVSNLIEAYRQSITQLTWMSPETKEKALVKLEKFTPKVGYPDKWRDYSKLEIKSDDLMANIKAIAKFSRDYELNKLSGPVDRDEWHMTPQTVNAYYNPGLNEIVFPAAILQAPFFDPEADDAVNYGGIGAVIGHEIGHGFDDQGSRYDGDGNLIDWWTEKDRKEFEARTALLIDQYNQLSPTAAPDVKVNGEFTLGENIGDLGGMNIGMKAYRIALAGKSAPVIDGLTGDQRFFLGWAQCWRRLIRPEEARRRIATDPHSPDELRCNQIVRNMDEFYDAFDVKPGDALYLEQRVQIW